MTELKLNCTQASQVRPAYLSKIPTQPLACKAEGQYGTALTEIAALTYDPLTPALDADNRCVTKINGIHTGRLAQVQNRAVLELLWQAAGCGELAAFQQDLRTYQGANPGSPLLQTKAFQLAVSLPTTSPLFRLADFPQVKVEVARSVDEVETHRMSVSYEPSEANDRFVTELSAVVIEQIKQSGLGAEVSVACRDNCQAKANALLNPYIAQISSYPHFQFDPIDGARGSQVATDPAVKIQFNLTNIY